jgi:putative DNA methylase
MSEPKKLIEVAMPIKEISAESVRDKSIRHGHISTLHLWWARRPLPVCRGVIFASLVPDPLDENCPNQFKEALEILLGKKNNIGDPYHPYKDIPWTSVFDPMEDNLRNRLQMFIGKFSYEMQQHLLNEKKKPGANNLLNDASLIKWENKNNEEVIIKAKKLIYVAFNSKDNSKLKVSELLSDFDNLHNDIKKAEEELYKLQNRHILNDEITLKQNQLQEAIENFLNKMPIVFDPFAGGGAIPLEASRLGCRSFGNDINPVAHIIQRGSLEIPQKFGKPIVFSKNEFISLYGIGEWNKLGNDRLIYSNGDPIGVHINNRLSFDIEYYAMKLLHLTENEIGSYYPSNENGKKPIAYYWAKVGTCSNPSCKAKVPLLKQFYLANSPTRKVFLKPIINGNKISFEIKRGLCSYEGWMNRGNLICPVCNNSTDVKTLKKQFLNGETTEKLLAVIWEGNNSKEYKLPTEKEIEVTEKIPKDIERPNEKMPVEYTQAMPCCTWGIERWGQMFSNRQIFALHTFVKNLNIIKSDLDLTNEYNKALITYLSILIDRISSRLTNLGLWHNKRETLEQPFGRQAIPMIFDYPELNPLALSGGGFLNQLLWLIRYNESESLNPFYSVCNNTSSGDKFQFDKKQITAVVTDPPYYDAIAYADLSDFFYVWLKRTLGDVYADNFATPQTPKADECTALKHHHSGSAAAAKEHFELKLLQIFDAIEQQTSDIVSIMFAHQSTDAWSTLCNSILGARMNITGSWATDTEMTGALKTDKSFLSSSVTVSCKPEAKIGNGDFKIVKKAIEDRVEDEVDLLYKLGFRGADLLTACFGQAVSEFGKFNKVEKADGSDVTVSELLELTRESAFNSLLKGFSGDDYTKFYIGWLQLNGFIESEFDDAAKFTKVGLTINVQDLFKEHILIKNNNKQHLGSLRERLNEISKLGEGRNNSLIDQTHKLMHLYSSPNRINLLKYIKANQIDSETSIWRVLTSLVELLPKDMEDHKLAVGLLTNKDQLIREAKSSNSPKPEQGKLTLE